MQDTRQQILEALRARGSATVQELADAVGVTPMSVRYHLQGLQEQGLVARAGEARLGRAGRPQHLYALVSRGSLPARLDYRTLLATLLEETRTLLGERAFEGWLLGAAARQAAPHAERLAGASLERRLREATGYLSRQGHWAQWHRDEEGLALHCYNCPYHPLPRGFPVLCQMDVAFVSGFLGQPV
ncbi:MAG: helix-turn-helix domain-containing protein, partial [Anaerolineae bacterium]|nr:helix-turn-helix domain-containing protein [Anaerolineae bacterium]